MSSDVELHPDGLWLGEIIDRRSAVFATQTRVALAAPRQPHIGIAVGIDPDRARPRLLGKTLHPSHVTAPDARGEAVRCAVGNPQRVGFVTELDDADDRAKDF